MAKKRKKGQCQGRNAKVSQDASMEESEDEAVKEQEESSTSETPSVSPKKKTPFKHASTKKEPKSVPTVKRTSRRLRRQDSLINTSADDVEEESSDLKEEETKGEGQGTNDNQEVSKLFALTAENSPSVSTKDTSSEELSESENNELEDEIIKWGSEESLKDSCSDLDVTENASENTKNMTEIVVEKDKDSCKQEVSDYKSVVTDNDDLGEADSGNEINTEKVNGSYKKKVTVCKSSPNGTELIETTLSTNKTNKDQAKKSKEIVKEEVAISKSTLKEKQSIELNKKNNSELLEGKKHDIKDKNVANPPRKKITKIVYDLSSNEKETKEEESVFDLALELDLDSSLYEEYESKIKDTDSVGQSSKKLTPNSKNKNTTSNEDVLVLSEYKIWRNKEVLIVGDTRAKSFASHEELVNFHLFSEDKGTVTEFIALADKALEKHSQAEILVMFSFHCDLTKTTTCTKNKSNMVPAAIVNCKELMCQAASATLRWQKAYPELIILWPLPYNPDFSKYNNQHLEKGSGENEKKFGSYVKILSDLKKLLFQSKPFLLSELYPRFGKKSFQKLFSEPFMGPMSDGLHPSTGVVLAFWSDFYRDIAKFYKSSDKGKHPINTTELAKEGYPSTFGASFSLIEEDSNEKKSSGGGPMGRRVIIIEDEELSLEEDVLDFEEEVESEDEQKNNKKVKEKETKKDVVDLTIEKDLSSGKTFQKIIIVGYPVYKEALKDFKQPKVQLLADKEWELESTSQHIKMLLHNKPSKKTLVLIMINSFSIFKTVENSICVKNKCSKPLLSLQSEPNNYDMKTLWEMKNRYRQVYLSVINDVQHSVDPDSAVLVIPPIAPVIHSETKITHAMLHSLSVDDMQFYTATDDTIDKLNTFYTYFSKAMVTMSVQEFCKQKCFHDPIVAYENSLPLIGHLQIVKNIADSKVEYLNTWKKAVSKLITSLLDKHDIHLTEKVTDSSKIVDHLKSSHRKISSHESKVKKICIIGSGMANKFLENADASKEEHGIEIDGTAMNWWNFSHIIENLPKVLKPDHDVLLVFGLMREVWVAMHYGATGKRVLQRNQKFSLTSVGESMTKIVNIAHKISPNTSVVLVLPPIHSMVTDVRETFIFKKEDDSIVDTQYRQWSHEVFCDTQAIKDGADWPNKLFIEAQKVLLEIYPIESELGEKFTAFMEQKTTKFDFSDAFVDGYYPTQKFMSAFWKLFLNTSDFMSGTKMSSVVTESKVTFNKNKCSTSTIHEDTREKKSSNTPSSVLDENETDAESERYDRFKSLTKAEPATNIQKSSSSHKITSKPETSTIPLVMNERRARNASYQIQQTSNLLNINSPSNYNNNPQTSVPSILGFSNMVYSTQPELQLINASVPNIPYFESKPQIMNQSMTYAQPITIYSNPPQPSLTYPQPPTMFALQPPPVFTQPPPHFAPPMMGPPLQIQPRQQNIIYSDEAPSQRSGGSQNQPSSFSVPSKDISLKYTQSTRTTSASEVNTKMKQGIYHDVNTFISNLKESFNINRNFEADISFQNMYIIGGKNIIQSLSQITLNRAQLVEHDLAYIDEENLSNLVRKLYRPSRSVCFLAFDLSCITEIVPVSSECEKFECLQPISVNAFRSQTSYILKKNTRIINRMKQLVEVIEKLSKVITVIVLPMFPSKVLCDDASSAQKHRMIHNISRDDIYVVMGKESVWENKLSIFMEMWDALVKLNHKKYISEAMVTKYIDQCKNTFNIKEDSTELHKGCILPDWKDFVRRIVQVFIAVTPPQATQPQGSSRREVDNAKATDFVVLKLWNLSNSAVTDFLSEYFECIEATAKLKAVGATYALVSLPKQKASLAISILDRRVVGDTILRTEVIGQHVDCSFRDSTEKARFDDIYAKWKFKIEEAIDHRFKEGVRLMDYKTRRCDGKCRGKYDTCSFFHSNADKRRDVMIFSYTGSPCVFPKTSHECAYGSACKFSHNMYEQVYFPTNCQTTLCRTPRGTACKTGSGCKYAHIQTPEMFYVTEWEDLVVSGSHNTLNYIAGAIRGLAKINKNKELRLLVLSPYHELLRTLKEVVDRCLLRLAAPHFPQLTTLLITPSRNISSTSHIVFGTPALLANARGNLIPYGTRGTIIVDSVNDILDLPFEKKHLVDICKTLSMYPRNTLINKVFVSSQYERDITSTLSALLRISLREVKNTESVLKDHLPIDSTVTESVHTQPPTSNYPVMKSIPAPPFAGNFMNFPPPPTASNFAMNEPVHSQSYVGSVSNVYNTDQPYAANFPVSTPAPNQTFPPVFPNFPNSGPVPPVNPNQSGFTHFPRAPEPIPFVDLTLPPPSRGDASLIDSISSLFHGKKVKPGPDATSSRPRSKSPFRRSKGSRWRSRSRSPTRRSRSRSRSRRGLRRKSRSRSRRRMSRSRPLHRSSSSDDSASGRRRQRSSRSRFSPSRRRSLSRSPSRRKRHHSSPQAEFSPKWIKGPDVDISAHEFLSQSSLRRLLGEEMYDCFLEREKLLHKTHTEEYIAYENFPELHSDYEVYYEQCCAEYKQKFGSSMGEKNTYYWVAYWKTKCQSIERKDWNSKRQALLKELKAEARVNRGKEKTSYKPSPPGQALFSVDGTLDVLEQVSEKLGVVGPAMIAIINSARNLGVDTAEGLSVFTNDENRVIMNMVLDKLKMLKGSPTILAPIFGQAADWVTQLLEQAENPHRKMVEKKSLNLGAIATASVGRDSQFIISLIKTALVYEGLRADNNDEINDLFLKVCSLHFSMATSSQ